MPRYLYEIIGGILIVLSSFVAEQMPPRWRRACWLAFVLLALGYIAVGIRLDRDAKQREASYQTQIGELNSAVRTANRNQQDNTRIFANQFQKLGQRVADLQTEVKTANLQKEAAQLKAELESTQKALHPPKATLTFTLVPLNPDGTPATTVTLPVKDNVVHVKFSVLNNTDVAALDGDLTLMICDACKFAAEPPQFTKLPGDRDTHRVYMFQRILGKTQLATLSADVRVPPAMQVIKIGIAYRCRTCIIPGPYDNTGTILISRIQ